jgi:hypothetical protein
MLETSAFHLTTIRGFSSGGTDEKDEDAPPPQRRTLPQAHRDKVKSTNLFCVQVNLLVDSIGSDNLMLEDRMP